MDEALRTEFRQGFYPDRLADWIDDPIRESEESAPDVTGCLAALERGQRDFSYPGHDAVVFRLLMELVPKHGSRRGADIGCATGCFPAMQLAAGIEVCTVFEVRPTTTNDPRVEVRIHDLAYADDVQPEFDLVTCLSTIEHVGLGRYGDPLDPWGDVKMARNLRRLLKPGGLLLVSFPTGTGCVVFNKHRVYSRHRRIQLFDGLKLQGAYSDRSLAGRARHEAARLLQGAAGRFRQPIYLLRAR